MAKIDIKTSGIMIPCGVFGCNTPAKYNVGNASHMYDRLFLCQDCLEAMTKAFAEYKAPGEVKEVVEAQETVEVVEIVDVTPEPTTEPIPEPETETEADPIQEPEPMPEPEPIPQPEPKPAGYETLSRQELVALAIEREIPGAGPTKKSADLIEALKAQDGAL